MRVSRQYTFEASDVDFDGVPELVEDCNDEIWSMPELSSSMQELLSLSEQGDSSSFVNANPERTILRSIKYYKLNDKQQLSQLDDDFATRLPIEHLPTE